jgi:Tfp pilus assembly protein PilF
MPYLQEAEIGHAIPYGRSDHTIPVPRPLADSLMGVRPACSTCHEDRSVRDLQADVDRWWGRPRPRRPGVAALLAADTAPADSAAPLLVHAAPGDPMARYAGLARLFAGHLTPGVAPPPAVRDDLERLARTGDLDARGLALAALDVSAAGDSAEHARLAGLARSDPGTRRDVTRRWAEALGWMADRYRDGARPDSAAVLYRLGLGVAPDDPDLRIGLGYALLASGDPARALDAFRGAERLRPDDALLVVNEGLALLRLGRTDEATAAYGRALEIDPAEPLAHFNLGNAYLRAGDPGRAAGEYRRTIELDASLAPAHFNLARALLSARRYRPALQALRDGLAYDSSNADARELAGRLEEALRGR